MRPSESKIGGIIGTNFRGALLRVLNMTVQAFYNLVEQANDGMSIVQETMFRYVNPKMAEMMGYLVPEVLNRPFINYIYPDDRQKVFQYYRRSIAGEDVPSEYETGLRHREGHKIPIDVTARISSYKGSPADLIVVRKSIERKRPVAADGERKKLQRPGRCITKIVFEFNESGDLTFANRHALKSTGYTEEDLDMGLNVLQLFVPEDRKRVKNHMSRVLGRETVGTNEYTAMEKDGRRFPVVILECSTIMCGESPVGLRVFLTEITERKQAGEALRESEERYRFLFENSHDAIFIADLKTDRILDANRQAEKLIGFSRQEIIGMYQSQLHPLEYEEYYRRKFREHVRKGSVFDLEAEIMKRDKSIVPVSIRASMIRYQGRETIQSLFTDNSREKMLLELKEELAARKLIELAKGILMDRHKIDEKRAMSRLQKESRRQRKKIKEIAQAVISADAIF